MAGKYQSLSRYLQRQSEKRIPLSFAKIEDIIGNKLPPSARKYQAWWANQGATSPQSQAWMEYGWRTEDLNLSAQTVTFVREG